MKLNEGFFAAEVDEEDKCKPLKRGCGSQCKTKVAIMTESKPVEGKTIKIGKPRKGGHLKMVSVIKYVKTLLLQKSIVSNNFSVK